MGGDTLKEGTSVEELTCLELARMWDTEDVAVPWDWKQTTQQQQKEESEGEVEGEESGISV
jgi:hypothetical protein